MIGLSTDIIVEIIERIGMKDSTTIELEPWARGYNEVLNSKNAAIYGTVQSPGRMDKFKWVCPIGCAQIGVLARKDDGIVLKSLVDFQKYRIGVVREDIGHQLIRGFVPERYLDIANSSESNWKKLQDGRIDLFVYDAKVAAYALKYLGFDPDKYEVVYSLKKYPLCIAFNKNADETIVNAFQKELDALIQERDLEVCY
ncbi:ABC transporter substrate-binding protein [Pseudodesulfovibrio sp. zrk46]|uniref:substrate-binding periplasmic protein n=1 Tax=Pseudodesulfovibrio sp. zrk46 TaxID=2725288 RepID=UPI001FFD6952|nr:ABC transporter substrate-binding protein [Pseudodesulfovibrio sp. zrk46]